MSDLSGTVQAGALVVLDPSDQRVLTLPWGDTLPAGVAIGGSTYTIVAIRQNGVTALTKDNAAIVSGNRATKVRLLATTATTGDRYRIDNQIVTTESPTQTVERSYFVRIETR